MGRWQASNSNACTCSSTLKFELLVYGTNVYELLVYGTMSYARSVPSLQHMFWAHLLSSHLQVVVNHSCTHHLQLGTIQHCSNLSFRQQASKHPAILNLSRCISMQLAGSTLSSVAFLHSCRCLRYKKLTNYFPLHFRMTSGL
jgi:hypothetical protein